MPVQGLPGASVYGCLMKTASVEILEAAIRLVMAGGQCFPSEQALQAPAQTICALPAHDADDAAAKGAMPISAGAQLLQITPRQYEVLVLLARAIRSRRSAACSTFRSPPPRRMPARSISACM